MKTSDIGDSAVAEPISKIGNKPWWSVDTIAPTSRGWGFGAGLLSSWGLGLQKVKPKPAGSMPFVGSAAASRPLFCFCFPLFFGRGQFF
jgi:hypothetical protein